MANINDFKIIKARSINKFSQAAKELCVCELIDKLDDNQKARLGFYFLTMEVLTGVSDFRLLDEFIIDCKYNETIHGKGMDDLGIDAVFIDESDGNHKINLFTYKYRDNFNPDRTQKEATILNSIKFLDSIFNMENDEDFSLIDEKVCSFIKDIIEKMQSNTPWEIILYSISNENLSFDKRVDPIIKNFKKSYGLEIKSIVLNDLIGFFSEKRTDKKCKFVVNKEDLLMYKSDPQVTNCSYVVRVNMIDVIRICGNDDVLACNYTLEDDNEICGTELDISLLYDNIRGYLGDTNYNNNIELTIAEEPENFFMFNNGLTIITSALEANEQNSHVKMRFELKDYQLVNGGQTINTIFQYLLKAKDENKIEKLRHASVLVRIFKVSENIDDGETDIKGTKKNKGLLRNRIAEYTNSQNSINPQDLKAVSSLQVQIQQYFEQNKIGYVRKAGIESRDSNYDDRITMEQLAKVLYSCMGHPERVTNQKRKLFTEYYENIFSENDNGFDFENALEKARKYFELRKKYSKYTEQRIYYLMYIIYKYEVQDDIAKCWLESTLNSYSSMYPARALIQKGFKDALDKTISSNVLNVS